MRESMWGTSQLHYEVLSRPASKHGDIKPRTSAPQVVRPVKLTLTVGLAPRLANTGIVNSDTKTATRSTRSDDQSHRRFAIERCQCERSENLGRLLSLFEDA